MENLFLQYLADGNLRKKKKKLPLGREKTLMNHLSKPLPNPLAGFVRTDVRMSISRREAEGTGGKISGSPASPSPALTPAGLLGCCTPQLRASLTSPEHGKEPPLSQNSSLTPLKELVRQTEQAGQAAARSGGRRCELRDNQAGEHHISRALTHGKVLCSGTADGIIGVADATPMAMALLGIIKVK